MNLIDPASEWLAKIERDHPPGSEITALYFGLMQTDKGYMVYLTGAEVYDPDDDDWAGEIDYQPPRVSKYLLLPREFTAGLKWKGVLELIAETLTELVANRPDRPLFEGRTLAAGFDDSDLVIVKAR